MSVVYLTIRYEIYNPFDGAYDSIMTLGFTRDPNKLQSIANNIIIPKIIEEVEGKEEVNPWASEEERVIKSFKRFRIPGLKAISIASYYLPTEVKPYLITSKISSVTFPTKAKNSKKYTIYNAGKEPIGEIEVEKDFIPESLFSAERVKLKLFEEKEVFKYKHVYDTYYAEEV